MTTAIKNMKKSVSAGIAILLLTSCVTVTDAPSVDQSAAHDTRINLGQRYLSSGDRDKARWQFSKALEFNKNSASAYQGIAMVHQANGEMEPAEENFLRALKLADKKTLASVQVSYGRYLMEVDRYGEACGFFEKAAGDFDYGRRPEALFMAGICAEKTGNAKRKVAALEHAVNLNNKFVPALIELSEIYFEQGEYEKSKKLLDRYERLAKDSARSLWLGLRIERIFGNKDKEATYALKLKNLHGYSKEYLAYKQLLQQDRRAQ